MDVTELNREQLIVLKQDYVAELVNEGTFAEVMGVDYDEPSCKDMADIDDFISDCTVFQHYSGMSFSEDDFNA